MQTLALVWGILAFVGFCIALIPCFGWLNWATIPFAVIGVLLGILGAARAGPQGRAPGPAVAGLVLSGVAVFFGLVRLLLGGGVL